MRLFEADAHHALIGMMNILPNVLTGLLKNTATRVHQLDLETRLSDRDAVLENYANKAHRSELPNLYADPNR